MRRASGTLAGAALVAAAVLGVAPRGPATPRSAAAAEADPLCVAGDEFGLTLWCAGPDGPRAWAYELGYADPYANRGRLPGGREAAPDGSPEKPAHLFRIGPADGAGTPCLVPDRLILVAGVAWDARRGVLVSGSGGGRVTEWHIAEGDLVEARVLGTTVTPPTFETTESDEGGVRLRRVVSGLPPRTRTEVTAFPRAPEDLRLGRSLRDAVAAAR